MIRLFVVLMLVSVASIAQERLDLLFTEENHDFGVIKEEDGSVTFDFEFANNGSEPVNILSVKPSCGCTTPSWTSDPILPGGKGVITAQFNPRNRPGVFRKSLTVSISNSEGIQRLFINGNVVPRTKTIEEQYPLKMGVLRFVSGSINFGRITTEKVVEKTIYLFNDSDSNVVFTQEVVAPGFINFQFDSLNLNPKSEGKLTLKYNPNYEGNLGFNSHSILLKTDEKMDSLKELHVMASIVEYFEPRTDDEMKLAPKLNIESRLFNFGKLKEGNSYEKEFVLTNLGKSDLNIRKIKSNCACLTYHVNKMNLSSGESMNLVLKLDTRNRRGNQIKNVTIYTNDPMDSAQLVTIKGNVVID